MQTLRAESRCTVLFIAFFLEFGMVALTVTERLSAQNPPKFQVDPAWPKELPNNWIMGQVGGMAVDRQDHIWVLQRPRSNSPDELGALSSNQSRFAGCDTGRAVVPGAVQELGPAAHRQGLGVKE